MLSISNLSRYLRITQFPGVPSKCRKNAMKFHNK
jgi:hypothetical protein